jgi:hypothetical protein
MILVKDLVAFAVSRMNIERSAAINQTVAPKVLFTGLWLDFCKELGYAFGDYCEVFNGTDNTSRVRSVPCVALYPCNNASGSWAFLNLKSRLVLHGNEQETSLYPDRLPPTVFVQAIITCLALEACNTAYMLGKINVKGAFIQTEMSGRPVYIQCTRQLKDLILDLYPEYSKYIGKDGVLYCKLLKSLCGCVQASKLWYEKVCMFLERLGYVRVPLCVLQSGRRKGLFTRSVGGWHTTHCRKV